MRIAASVAGQVATPPAVRGAAVAQCERQGSPDAEAAFDATAASIEEALPQLEHCANALAELQRAYRSTTLSAVATGTLNAGDAISRADTMRRLEALARHAWRAAAYLIGRESGSHRSF